MILGSIEVTREALVTHRDTYRRDDITVVSVRRPLLAPAILMAVGLGGFGLAFVDLLYAHEIVGFVVGAIAILAGGIALAQLKLLSRDLRGSETGDAIWGTYGHLNRIRREIGAVRASKPGAAS